VQEIPQILTHPVSPYPDSALLPSMDQSSIQGMRVNLRDWKNSQGDEDDDLDICSPTHRKAATIDPFGEFQAPRDLGVSYS